jgi:hypothetical protein
MVLRLIRALPGESAFLAPVAGGNDPTDVAPGSRRQDHTTSPSAAAFSSDGKTPPDAAASIASCTLRIVTIAKRPSVGAGWGGYAPDFYFCKAEYFSFRGLTRFRKTEPDLPVAPVCRTSPSFRGERSESPESIIFMTDAPVGCRPIALSNPPYRQPGGLFTFALITVNRRNTRPRGARQ